MPLYRYFCKICRARRDEFRKIDARDDAPTCHDRRMQRLIMPTMVATFAPYTTVAYDKETGKRMKIRTQDEHRAFLARNGYEEVGNDQSMAPLPTEEVAYQRRQKLKEERSNPEPDFEFDTSTHEATR